MLKIFDTNPPPQRANSPRAVVRLVPTGDRPGGVRRSCDLALLQRQAWLCCLLILVAGCALSKPKIIPDSLAKCRELSRDGVAAMQRCDWQRARSLLEAAVDTSQTDIDARRHLAEAQWETGDLRAAVVQMEAAVQLDPEHAATVVRAGEMLLGTGATQRALVRAEEAIALEPTLASAWVLRGRVFRDLGNAERALADLQQALRYAPQRPEVLLEVAEVQYSLSRPQRSLTTLHHLLDLYATGEAPQQALWLEGLAYNALGRHHDAVQSLHAASKRDPPRAELLYQLALAEKMAGKTTAATNTVRQALAVDAGHQSSQILLAQLQGLGAPGASDVIRR